MDVPADMEYVTLPEKPKDGQMWDASTKAFIQRPAKIVRDLIQELIDRPAVSQILSALTPTQRTAIKNAVVEFFGEWRYQ